MAKQNKTKKKQAMIQELSKLQKVKLKDIHTKTGTKQTTSENKAEKKSLGSSESETTLYIGGKTVWMKVDFSLETMKAREVNDTFFRYSKTRTVNPEFYNGQNFQKLREIKDLLRRMKTKNLSPADPSKRIAKGSSWNRNKIIKGVLNYQEEKNE